MQQQIMIQMQMQQSEWQKEFKLEQLKIQGELQKLREEIKSDDAERDLKWDIAVLKATNERKKQNAKD